MGMLALSERRGKMFRTGLKVFVFGCERGNTTNLVSILYLLYEVLAFGFRQAPAGERGRCDVPHASPVMRLNIVPT